MSASKLKPLTKATRSSLVARAGSYQLSSALEESLFRHADVLSEGGIRTGASGHGTYYGSTMMVVDLARLSVHCVGLGDHVVRGLLSKAVEGSIRVRLRVMRLARAEAVRRAPRCSLGTVMCEIRVRVTRDRLHIDVDLEVPLRVSSRATQS